MGVIHCDSPSFGAVRNGLHHIAIRADFAEDIVDSYSGGVNELETGTACTTDEAGCGLKSKINAALDSKPTRDISLRLTEDEAMCLACASQNCQLGGLPLAQLRRIQSWFDVWLVKHADP